MCCVKNSWLRAATFSALLCFSAGSIPIAFSAPEQKEPWTFAFPKISGSSAMLRTEQPPGGGRRAVLLEGAEGHSEIIPVEVPDSLLQQPDLLTLDDAAFAARYVRQDQRLNWRRDGIQWIRTMADWPAMAASAPALADSMAALADALKSTGGRIVQQIVLVPDGAAWISAASAKLKNIVSIDLLRKGGSGWAHVSIEWIPAGLAQRLIREASLRDKVFSKQPAGKMFVAFDPQTELRVIEDNIEGDTLGRSVLRLPEILQGIESAQKVAPLDQLPPATPERDVRLEKAFLLEVYPWGDVKPETQDQGIAATFLELGLHQPPWAYRTTP